MQFKVEIRRGEDARELFEAVGFRGQLQELHEQCPWSTVFQSPPFLHAWFRHYNTIYEPLIVIGHDGEGNLAGILPLAVERESGRLVFAGTHHAEYQVWLALPELRTIFIEAALEGLREAFPRGKLQLMYVRPDAPLESFRAGGEWHGFSELHAIPRGLMALGDGSAFRESMKKRHNATQLGGLKKLGTVRFEHVERPEELAADFDDIIAFNDFRKGATYNKLPFRSDPNKKPFHLSLLNIPRLLHVSVMRLDGKAISAYIAAIDRDQAIAILLAHSPFMAKYSVGRLHLLSLGMHLAEKGYREFDLTPGGGYKNQYATHYDDAFVLTIFFSRAACLSHKARMRVSGIGRKVLCCLSLEPERVRETLGGAIRNAIRPGTLAGAGAALFETRELKLYAADLGDFLNLENPHMMHRDDLNGLMAFQATDACHPSVQEFLSGAQMRLEAGHRAYTSVVDGVLVCSGWLAGQLKTLKFGEVGQEWRIPEGAVALYSFYLHPDNRTEDRLRGALVRMLHDASAIKGAKRAYVPVPGDDKLISRTIERLGFRHEASFFQRRTLGRAVRWKRQVEGVPDRASERSSAS
jgi:CelD/BcsL family acetyltransferase involved in cellulose biosynthesis